MNMYMPSLRRRLGLKRTSSIWPDREEQMHSRPRKGLDERHEFGKSARLI